MPTVFDADSHVMETPEWLYGFAEPDVRDRLPAMALTKAGPGSPSCSTRCPPSGRHTGTSRSRPTCSPVPKAGWRQARSTRTSGLVVPGPGPDALGIDAQLVFPTFSLGHFVRSDDVEVRYGGARALNRR